MNVAESRQAYREHLSGYQRRDAEVVDYQMYELEGTRLAFRGPAPGEMASGEYFTCLGAAQTLGCFCERPFPRLLAERLALPALNLGYGGAGPEFFERHESLDRYINRGKFVIVQVMSGRSQSNSLFDCRGLELLVRRSDGAPVSSYRGYEDLLTGVPALGSQSFGALTPLVQEVLRRALPKLILPRLWAIPKVRRIVRETRRAWVDSYWRFLSRIEVPVILFWFSKRSPAYVESLASLDTLFGEFPQLVNPEMVDQVRQRCESYVECVTQRGSPQPLVSRFTGAPVTVSPALDRADFSGLGHWTHNTYYPSPDMHEDGAEALFATCAATLAHGRRVR
jgi:Domain of unknown function (DUF6473)